jgi:hypothetical protein
MRFSGQVIPHLGPQAPLGLRLPAEVYSLDGLGQAAPYVLPDPGGRLEVGPHGKLYETLGQTVSKPISPLLVFGLGVVAGVVGYKMMRRR